MRNSGGYPVFMLPPQGWGGGEPERRREDVPELSVPARVRQAMMFVELCQQKTQQRAAVSESQIQLIDGQTLTDDEQTALATACNLLTKYFAGQTGFDKWEKIRFEALKQKIRKPKKQSLPPPSLERRVIGNCPNCDGQLPMVNSCPICLGVGEVAITPHRSPNRPPMGPTPEEGLLNLILGGPAEEPKPKPKNQKKKPRRKKPPKDEDE